MNNTSLTFFQRIKKPALFFSKVDSIYNQQRKFFKTLTDYANYFSNPQLHQYSKDHNTQKLCMSDLRLRSTQRILE